jgi:hypothetical protein
VGLFFVARSAQLAACSTQLHYYSAAHAANLQFPGHDVKMWVLLRVHVWWLLFGWLLVTAWKGPGVVNAGSVCFDWPAAVAAGMCVG